MLTERRRLNKDNKYQHATPPLPEQYAGLYIDGKTEIPLRKLAVNHAFSIAISVLVREKYRPCVPPLNFSSVAPLEPKMCFVSPPGTQDCLLSDTALGFGGWSASCAAGTFPHVLYKSREDHGPPSHLYSLHYRAWGLCPATPAPTALLAGRLPKHPYL